jgi:hypothetical protein
LKDCNVLRFDIYGPTTGAKSTYTAKFIDYSGDKESMAALMQKVKNIVKRERIRLLEFFQDHDTLRKGVVEPTKFRSVLHSQKVVLTQEEYCLLEKTYGVLDERNAPLVTYVPFCEEIGNIFTEKDLEKIPTKRLTSFVAPSILDPSDVLNGQEEECLDALLHRFGEQVRLRRLLIKPFFQDKDKSRSGFISMTRFRQIMDNFKLHASEQEFKLVNKRFQAKAANEINYTEFDHVLRQYSGDLELPAK